MKQLETVPCIDCEDGTVQVQSNCGVPVSECCGGCFEPKQCGTCNGSGVIELNDEMKFILNGIVASVYKEYYLTEVGDLFESERPTEEEWLYEKVELYFLNYWEMFKDHM